MLVGHDQWMNPIEFGVSRSKVKVKVTFKLEVAYMFHKHFLLFQGSKKTEPKPMIDNPNASATKSTNLIRPQPLKMPDSEAVDVAGKSSFLARLFQRK